MFGRSLYGNREISRSADVPRGCLRGKLSPAAVSHKVYSEGGRTQRPLAVAALEDKIVQGAVAMVLSAVYEEEFLGFSYGFGPDGDRTMRSTLWRSKAAR